jgi:hypothetical protein
MREDSRHRIHGIFEEYVTPSCILANGVHLAGVIHGIFEGVFPKMSQILCMASSGEKLAVGRRPCAEGEDARNSGSEDAVTTATTQPERPTIVGRRGDQGPTMLLDFAGICRELVISTRQGRRMLSAGRLPFADLTFGGLRGRRWRRDRLIAWVRAGCPDASTWRGFVREKREIPGLVS